MKSFLIQLMALPMLMGGVVNAGEKEPVPVYAEVEETEDTEWEDIQANEETSIVDKVENAYNTYIAPLLAGVGITSVLSAVVSIVFAVKNRKDKKNIENNSTTTTKNANAIIEKAEELSKACNSLKEMCEKDHTLSKEAINVFNEKAKLLTNEISSLQKDVSNLFEIKAYVLNMAQIMSTMASHIPELRESGCAEEIEKIVNKIK